MGRTSLHPGLTRYVGQICAIAFDFGGLIATSLEKALDELVEAHGTYPSLPGSASTRSGTRAHGGQPGMFSGREHRSTGRMPGEERKLLVAILPSAQQGCCCSQRSH
jgi:hypothetical protein